MGVESEMELAFAGLHQHQDMNIPVALHRFMAERARAESSRELAGASRAPSVSEPKAVTATILEATALP